MRILTFSSALVAVMAFGYWAGHRASEAPVTEALTTVYPGIVAGKIQKVTDDTRYSDENIRLSDKLLPAEIRLQLIALARANYDFQKAYSNSAEAIEKRVRCPHLMAVPSRDDGLCLNVETATYSELLCLAGDEIMCSKLPSR